MKKFVMAFAVVAVVALFSANAMAWGMHGWQGNGCGRGYTSQVDQKAYQDFLSATSDLRASVRADRAEIAAIMAGQNPDAKRVRTLTENIDKNAAAIQDKATALGLPQNGGMGYGFMRGGRMGYGHGNGVGCPAWQ